MTSYLQTLKNLQNAQTQQQRLNAPLNQIYSQEYPTAQINQKNISNSNINDRAQYSQVYYVPHKAKIMDYEDRIVVQRVPRTRKVLQYEERVITQMVPREVSKTQYYAVEHLTHYQKQIIPEVKIEYVPVQKKVKRIQYVPVPKQIIYYPESVKVGDQTSIQKITKVDLLDNGIPIQSNSQIRPLSHSNIRNANIKESQFTMTSSPYPSYRRGNFYIDQGKYTPSSQYDDSYNYDYVIDRSPSKMRSRQYLYDEQNYYKNKYYLNKLRSRFGMQDSNYRNIANCKPQFYRY